MRKRAVVAMVAVAALVFAGCGGEAATCDELADQAVDLIQDLIAEVEAEFGDTPLQDLTAETEFPSSDRFEEESDALDARAEELGCSDSQMAELTAARLGRLEASTPIGRFIVEAFRAGGL